MARCTVEWLMSGRGLLDVIRAYKPCTAVSESALEPIAGLVKRQFVM